MGYRMDDLHTKGLVCGPGGSGYTAHSFGQEAVCIAQAFFIAGYPLFDPVKVIGKLNNIQCWTDGTGSEGPGLVDWNRIAIALPQIKPGGSGYSLVQGVWGRFNHTLLFCNGVYFDPFTGTNIIPSGWHTTGRVRTFDIGVA